MISSIQSIDTKEKDGRVYCAFIRLTAKDRIRLANICVKSAYAGCPARQPQPELITV
ncbi:hypothetical protein ACNKHL_22170 [Shigella flexneri]